MHSCLRDTHREHSQSHSGCWKRYIKQYVIEWERLHISIMEGDDGPANSNTVRHGLLAHGRPLSPRYKLVPNVRAHTQYLLYQPLSHSHQRDSPYSVLSLAHTRLVTPRRHLTGSASYRTNAERTDADPFQCSNDQHQRRILLPGLVVTDNFYSKQTLVYMLMFCILYMVEYKELYTQSGGYRCTIHSVNDVRYISQGSVDLLDESFTLN